LSRLVALAGPVALAGAVALAAAVAIAAGVAGSRPLAARAASPSYADAVDRALAIVRSAPDGDAAAAARAADALQAGTGGSQPEILADLRAQPPRTADARARLSVLGRAARDPAFTPEPRKADRAVRDILAQPRYDPLRGGPSLWDRIQEGTAQALVWLLDRLAPSAGVPGWVRQALPGAAAAVLGAAALGLLLVLRAGRPGSRREARLLARDRPDAVARDRFAEADRLAAAGDPTGAVRSLAGGVAAALGDERDWEASPLTVREIFRRSSDPGGLRPLLAAFEAAVYGGHAPERDAYERAAAAAAPYRRQPEGRAA
jgi:hypothetical protein